MAFIYDNSLIGKKQSVVDEILLLNPNQTPLINLLGFSTPVTQTTHQWFEDEMFATESTTTASALVGGTTVAVASAEPFRVGSVIKIGDELLKVTAVSGTDLTVTRGYASTTAAAIASGAKVEVLFEEGVEGANARSARYKARSAKSNYTQIFDDSVSITGSAQAVQQYGITDIYSYEKQKKQVELALRLEKALINGVGFDNGTVRALKGIRAFITTNVANASNAALTADMINNQLQAIFEKGGFASGGNYAIMVGAKQKRAISGLSKDNIRLTQDETVRGQSVTTFISDFGSFPIVLNNNLGADELYVVDTNRIAIKPLVGREFFHKYMGEVGDNTTGMLVGEYTLEFKQEKAHARIKGLA